MAIIIRDHDGFCIRATCNVIELIALREETCAQAVYRAVEFAADLGSQRLTIKNEDISLMKILCEGESTFAGFGNLVFDIRCTSHRPTHYA